MGELENSISFIYIMGTKKFNQIRKIGPLGIMGSSDSFIRSLRLRYLATIFVHS